MSGGVLLVVTGLAVGGAETELVQLAERLAGRAWRVRVVSLLPLEGTADAGFLARLERAGVEVESLGMARGRPDPRALWRLRRLVRRWRPDVVHSFMVHANLIGRLVRLLAPVPVQISTAQNSSEGGGAREWLYRLTDRLADCTTQVSESGARRYRRRRLVAADRLEVIRNSVDPDRFAPDPAARERLRVELGLGQAFTWLAVGHLEPQKDYPTLLRAFAETDGATGSSRLLIAGHGSRRAEIERLASELGLGESLNLLGLRRDVAHLLAAADGFVMSSAWEGTPLALLEAAASGLPAVVTDVGGNAEVLADGAGFVVPAGLPAELAAAMRRVEQMPPDERQALGGRARERVIEQYGLARNVERWEELYRRLLAARRGRRGEAA